LSLGGVSPYTSTDKTNENKYTYTKQYKKHSTKIQNTVNRSTHVTKTPTHYTTRCRDNEENCRDNNGAKAPGAIGPAGIS